ncbi:type II toxin-antitoxin system HicB family antitoxin [Candidatus Woesearchaeota archaeon]|nr:type II toxin-antitoxin system HicB family antitoxin [Candidatus Woesearchaeota archaeon]
MTEIILTCVITKEEGRYASVCPELDVASMGDTPEEAQENLQEAVSGHLAIAGEEGLLQDIYQ